MTVFVDVTPALVDALLVHVPVSSWLFWLFNCACSIALICAADSVLVSPLPPEYDVPLETSTRLVSHLE